MKIILLFLCLFLCWGCGADYKPDCGYLPPQSFEISRTPEGKYIIKDYSDERAEHTLFPRGMKVLPVNVFESETFEDSCSAKGFLKTRLEEFDKEQ